VSAVSARNVWAAGEVQYGSTIHSGVFYRWDGAHWRTVKGPGGDGVEGIAAVTASDVWAVGYDNPFFGGEGGWIHHWDGARWQKTRLPRRDLLGAVAPDGRGGLWAVGATNEPLYYHERIKPRPLTERYGC
jgi:hypothetical protein